jgi:unsaturated rhamnogalacturonyl hydrolase
VRYVGHGNSKNLWNSLTKVDIHTQSDPRLACIKGSVDIQLYRPAVDDWFWVDAMFMEAPVLSKLCDLFQDTAYCAKLYAMYNDTKTRRGLYDAAIRLWYRDANFIKRKTFWSRGNGWVMAALVRVLEHLPADDPHRNEYIRGYHDLNHGSP